MRKHKFKSGMSLVELVIVIGLLGVLFTAIYMFFVKGTEQFHFVRQQNTLSTTGKLILEEMSDEMAWAGYMPNGGWTDDLWKPIEVASAGTFKFYADFDGDVSLQTSDYRSIFRDANNHLHITDDAGKDRVLGIDVVDMEFKYMNSTGDLLPTPLTMVNRRLVRHIQIVLTLESSYMGDVYQTVMRTGVTPRNLGICHDFDPLFYLTPPIDGKMVVNIGGVAGNHLPTADEAVLVNLLDDWGYTLIQLADDELLGFDYDSSEVDLIILRNSAGSHNDIPGLASVLQSSSIPILMLDPDDAVDIFAMGQGPGNSVSPGYGEMNKTVVNHPIHKNITNNTFRIYKTLSGTTITTLDSLYSAPLPAGIELITASNPALNSGICVRNQGNPLLPIRIHYCAPDFANYSSDGFMLLHNVLSWTLPGGTVPPLGDEIALEGFEGDRPGDIAMVLWEDELENGLMLKDSVPILERVEMPLDMSWWVSLSQLGRVTQTISGILQMDMESATRGGAYSAIGREFNLSSFNTARDDLYLTINTFKGARERIDKEDGIFLYSSTGTPDLELLSVNFDSSGYASYVEFWQDPYGRHRVHKSPWRFERNPSNMVTLDADRWGRPLSRSRMIMKVDVSNLPNGTPITVDYRMSDHGDEVHSYNPHDNSGDYVGWSLGNGINDKVEGHRDINPEDYDDGAWCKRSYTFTPSGSMPSTVYIVFSQYGEHNSVGNSRNDGTSFDDIRVYVDYSRSNMTRVGIPSSADGWQKLTIDLDDVASASGIPFNSTFGIALSQAGTGAWPDHGIQWNSLSVGSIENRFGAPGWSHGPMQGTVIDDWKLENISGNYKWTLHANDSQKYSKGSFCYLEMPPLHIPGYATDTEFSFEHSMYLGLGTNAGNYGFLELSVDDGKTWSFLELSDYNKQFRIDGRYVNLFGSKIKNSTVRVPLNMYVGHTVRIRFIFKSNFHPAKSGWILDNFKLSGNAPGIEIKSIGFKPTASGGNWKFQNVDVYLGSTTESSFAGNGELDKSELTFCGTYQVNASATDWATIDLAKSYFLGADANLIVKVEMSQNGNHPQYSWVAGTQPATARWAVSRAGDPSQLKVVDAKPAFMIETANNGRRTAHADSTGSTPVMPLAFSAVFGDFEAIYSLSELGFGDSHVWVFGGRDNDWEVGVPLFSPDVDPALVPFNENRIVGTDLTGDGYYKSEVAWSWLSSGAYAISATSSYDSVCVAYDRCLRLAHNDLAYVQIAFATSPQMPTDNSDWSNLKVCKYNDDLWCKDVIQLTQYIGNAKNAGKTHYFIRFVLSSGPFAELGGWNLDNVGIYGRNK